MSKLDYRMVSNQTQWGGVAASKTLATFEGAMADSSAGPLFLLLPANPSVGDHISVKDASGSFATNNVTVTGNGNTIDGATTLVLSTNNDSKVLVWTGVEWKVDASRSQQGGGG